MGGAIAVPLFYCGTHVGRGKLLLVSVSLARKQPVRYHASPHWPSESRSVGASFFLGIGFALIKQLVRVDIGFTLLADCWNPHND